MAIRKLNQPTGEQNYLKVTGLSIVTIPAVTGAEITIDNHDARIEVTVKFEIYKNMDERFNPVDPLFVQVRSYDRTFSFYPDLIPGWMPISTDPDIIEYEKMIARGYSMLRITDEFNESQWEDYQ